MSVVPFHRQLFLVFLAAVLGDCLHHPHIPRRGGAYGGQRRSKEHRPHEGGLESGIDLLALLQTDVSMPELP